MKREIISGAFFVAIVLSNIITNRLVMIGDMVLPGAFVLYAITFLCTDIMSERYGRDFATKAVWWGFGFSIVAMGLIFIIGRMPSPVFAGDVNDAYSTFFATNARIVIGSMVAYLVSQNVDIRIFHAIGTITGHKRKWLRNNGSTMISQAVDTAIFITIAFWGSPGIMAIMVSQYIIKLVVAALDTPVFYALTRGDD